MKTNTFLSAVTMLFAASTANAQYVHVSTKDGSVYLFEGKDVKTMTIDADTEKNANSVQVNVELRNGSEYLFNHEDIESMFIEKPEHGIDMTYKIVNPSFENGTIGWHAADGTSSYYTQTNNEFKQKKGNTYAEFWQKNGTYTIQQVIANMPAGVYQLSAYASSMNNTERLFINDAKSEIIRYQDENPESFYSVYYVNEKAGDLTIGVSAYDNGGSWNTVDDFTLRFCGNSNDVWAKALPTFNGETASQFLMDKYQGLVEAVRNADETALKTSYDAAKGYINIIEENIAAWEEYEALAIKAEKYASQPALAEVTGEISTYLKNNRITPDMESKGTDDIKAESVKLRKMLDDLVDNIPSGTDVTFLFTNTDFTQGWTGWNILSGSNGNIEANRDSKCAEAWFSSDFDIYQQIENAPAGLYKIEVQGFYRYDRDDDAWRAFFDSETGKKKLDAPNSNAFVYLNDDKTPLANVFDCQVENGTLYSTSRENLAPYVDPNGEYWYPNDMTAAGQAFDQGYYKVYAKGYVANKGEVLRLGIKGNTTQNGDSWAIFTRFNLVYMGPESDNPTVELKSGDKVEGTVTINDKTYTKAVGGTVANAVDLGLPSGTLWADHNIGATSPEEYGAYIAWAEIGAAEQGYVNGFKTGYASNTTEYYDSESGNWIKYVSATKTVLDANDDAATVNWGSKWSMPTLEQIQELENPEFTTWTLTNVNGVAGYEVRSNINNNTIFLPANGYRGESELYNDADWGNYWSNAIGYNTDCGHVLYFGPDVQSIHGSADRYSGCGIRPVRH